MKNNALIYSLAALLTAVSFSSFAHSMRTVSSDVHDFVASQVSAERAFIDATIDESIGTADCVEALAGRFGDAAVIDSWSIESLCDFEGFDFGGAQ